jgi:hypothetical protein
MSDFEELRRVIAESERLIVENAMLRQELDALRAERDEAIGHLTAVLNNPYSRSAEKTKALIEAQDWARGQIDTALGKVTT